MSTKKAKAGQEIFYSEAFKQKVVHEVLSGKLNKLQAKKIYGIRGNSEILYWIRKYQGIVNYKKAIPTIANFAEMKKDIHDKKLEQEHKELKELLRIAELRADLWQHMIEVAEKKFNIEIGKKPGAQLSKVSKSKDLRKK